MLKNLPHSSAVKEGMRKKREVKVKYKAKKMHHAGLNVVPKHDTVMSIRKAMPRSFKRKPIIEIALCHRAL